MFFTTSSKVAARVEAALGYNSAKLAGSAIGEGVAGVQVSRVNLACEGGDVINFNRNTIKFLKDFGVSEGQIESLSKGKQIIFEDYSTKFPTATIFQVDGKILKAGIWDVVADKPGALKSFAQRTKNLAKDVGCDKIELFGADIQNERLLNVLNKRYGFYPGEPIIISEFGFKSFEVNTLRKTIDLKLTSEFSKFIAQLS